MATYIVTGAGVQFGDVEHETGDTFDRDLKRGEGWLVVDGHLVVHIPAPEPEGGDS